MLKRMEELAKILAAYLAAALLYRPRRKRLAPQRLVSPKSVLLVRVDHRLGEVLLTTPLLAALAEHPSRPAVDLLVHERAVAMLSGHPLVRRVIPLQRKRLWLGPWGTTLRSLRRASYDVVVHCANWTAPSLTGSLVARLAGPKAVVIGPARPPTSRLIDVPVEPRADTASEVSQRLALLSPVGLEHRTLPLSFRAPEPSPGPRAFLRSLADPYAVVNPGGRLDERRVPALAFVKAAESLVRRGLVPVITWGPGEETLARSIVSSVEGSLLAPRTSVDDLAALMSSAALCVCNNSGPMHLAVAVGTPTLGLFVRIDPNRWGHPAPHRMLDLTQMLGDDASLAARVEATVAEWISTLAPNQAEV